MPPIDPFAPAAHPHHPRQAGARSRPRTEGDRMSDAIDREERVREYVDLQGVHLTAAEKATGEPESLPDLETLRLRRDALVDYLTRRDADPAAATPTIVDTNGDVHELFVSEDGREAHWELVPPHDPPADQDDAGETESTPPAAEPDPLDDALAQLDKARGRRR